MNNWYGNIVDNDTIYMTFNTFNSDGASVTATIVDGDIEVYKDGGLTQLATNGATVQKDFDGITGTHQITIDTSASGDYAIGSDYSVMVKAITVDTQTINAFVGTLSIQNRFMRGTDSAALDADKGDWATATGFAVAGDAMNLAADAIKAVSYDQSTAFPLADSDGTALTEAGGDGDHLVEAGGDGDQLTAINLPNQTMDIIGTLTGNLIGDVTGNVDGTVAGKTPSEAGDAMTLTSAAIDAILDEVVEGTITLRGAQKLMMAVLTGKSSGGDSSTIVFRDTEDTKNRISATVDANGNRTAVGTRDAT
jgi:hypothetical protein